ncbi:hypothetical protein CXB72_03285 [Lactobacillus acidophilus]|nr:hypothetical protein CXB72_03285 [Lactobacillus acidophilus]
MIVLRNRVIKAVEWFYLCVMMSIKFWWVLIKNYIVYGYAAAVYSIIRYYMTPNKDRDLHQKFKVDNKLPLKNSGLVSLITTFLISMWIAFMILLIQTHSQNLIIAVGFWVFAIWSVLMLAYLVDLSIVFITQKYDTARSYYIKAFVYLVRMPQITLTTIILLILTCIFIMKNAVIAVFIMPGIIVASVCKTYRLILEKDRLAAK